MPFKKHHEVSIYTSTGSELCQLTKDYFRTAGIDFFDYNITDNKTYEKELLEASGELITPVVIFDGRVIVGFQPDVYTMLIARSDALDKDRQDAASE